MTEGCRGLNSERKRRDLSGPSESKPNEWHCSCTLSDVLVARFASKRCCWARRQNQNKARHWAAFMQH